MRYLCDSNIWIALTFSGHFHAQAAAAWFEALTDSDSSAFCRNTHQSFMRLVTTAGMTAQYGESALSNLEAWNLAERFLDDSRVTWADEPAGLEQLWRQYSARRTASPKLWMDAYLAAFAVAGGLTFVTTDAAFRQFEGLDLLVLGSGDQ